MEPISTQRPLLLFTCQCIGSVHRKIDSSEGLFGTVLNVFDKAVNIRTNDDKLLVISLGQVASPITINVIPPSSSQYCDAFSNLIESGNDVSIVGKNCSAGNKTAGITQIMLGSKCAILVSKPVRLFENLILKPELESLLKFSDCREHLMSVLRECARDRAGSLLNPDITTKGLLQEFIDLIDDHTIDVKNSEFEDTLSRSLLGFCGRGPGFTPAGDDFIAGILSILNWIRSGLSLGSPIIPGSEYRKATTWTSFRLMECSCQGLVDIEVQELINSIADGDVSHYADSVRRIAKRGHTSGIDFVTGATIAIYLAIGSIAQTK